MVKISEFLNKHIKQTSLELAIPKLIEEFSRILELKDGWDGISASVFNEDEVLFAVKYTTVLSKDVYKKHKKQLFFDEINPCIDNTIDFSWREEGCKLLISVSLSCKSTSSLRIGWYGERGNSIIKGEDIILCPRKVPPSPIVSPELVDFIGTVLL